MSLVSTHSVVIASLLLLLGCSIASQPASENSPLGQRYLEGQKVFESDTVTYIVPRAPLRLKDQLDGFIGKLKNSPPNKSTLVCMLTSEIQGLFLCVGSDKAAQHVPLNRAAIFIESRPPLGVRQSREIISQEVSLSGYAKSSGHDLNQSHLEDFFKSVKLACPDISCLSNGEFVFASDVMTEFGARSSGGYSVVSVDVSNVEEMKRTLSHEISHGQFFQEPAYRAAVFSFWSGLSPEIRVAAQRFLSQNYDTSNIELLINEFQGFTIDGTFERIPESAVSQASDPVMAQTYAALRNGALQRRLALIGLLSSVTPTVWAVELSR